MSASRRWAAKSGRWIACGVAWIAVGVASVEAHAQDRAVVARVEQFGRTTVDEARSIVRAASGALAANAARSDADYDWVRRRANEVLYGPAAGPGRTPEEARERIAAVKARLTGGLDEALLDALFRAERGAAMRCAQDFGLPIPACDVLLAAGARRPAPLPYVAPDHGDALRDALRQAGLSRRDAQKSVDAIASMMAGVPRTVGRDASGQRLAALLASCPGGLSTPESQVRAWHVGPVEPLVRCIVGDVARRAGPHADAVLADQLRLERDVAAKLVAWTQGAPSREARSAAAGGAASSSNDPAAAERWRTVGRRHFDRRDFARAAAAYEAATAVDGTHAGSFAALGASRLAMGDPGNALVAYQKALELSPAQSSYYSALARAQADTGDRDGAVRSLRRALELDPANVSARDGLAALGASPPPAAPPPATARSGNAPPSFASSVGAPPPAGQTPAIGAAAAPSASAASAGAGPADAAPPPESPSRAQVLAVMRPLQARVAACVPEYRGEAVFVLSVEGATGRVGAATIDTAALADDPGAECMLGIVQSAVFPAFSREVLEIRYPYRLGQ